ncbi:Fis family transcriptional regulator [Salmonella enterica subsp. enterica serovar Hull]|uniref:Fis family transcriptional regulator n=1 Tax=Salmonella enterica subsp. enterica serovar Hull TaxID=1403564 RepID=A0A5X4PKG9_SALET|nr:Fis family transcriptional regulator [Salmonella enterica subsp. enterica serovar Putten]EBZ7588354.1 Fis family transcriptional regulator [Salmonella enterica subsp. enterica serovar Hull]EBZ8650732.1 Fis family transcriptional regulator [Salmonella enterica subsp. enterica serovar Hull]EEB7450857.1 Fis family transcriptional regulator [Salmonella enterica subsp. enterica serovar Emek]
MTKPASTTKKPRKQHTPEFRYEARTHWGDRSRPRT